MQIDRLFGLVLTLLEGNAVTAQALAERFHVSTRTIYRDIDTLSLSGVPIYAVSGRGGGYRILEQFTLNKTAINDREQNELLMALQGLSATGHVEVEATLQKLGALFQKTDISWIHVDYSRWGTPGTGDQKRFDTLKAVILDAKACRFPYTGTSGGAQLRTVEPARLVFKSKAWYLQAFCLDRQAWRLFKLSRMGQVEALEQACRFSRDAIPPIEPDNVGQHPPLTIRFQPELAARLYDEFDEQSITVEPDGHYLVTASMPIDRWLYGYLLSFGTGAQVLSPPEVAGQLGLMAREIAKRYPID